MKDVRKETVECLIALAEATARDPQEERAIMNIAMGIEEERCGRKQSAEWWAGVIKAVSFHAEYASAYAYGAACDAAKLAAEGKWHMVPSALDKALGMANP